jgi:hypothetical protein
VEQLTILDAATLALAVDAADEDLAPIITSSKSSSIELDGEIMV